MKTVLKTVLLSHPQIKLDGDLGSARYYQNYYGRDPLYGDENDDARWQRWRLCFELRIDRPTATVVTDGDGGGYGMLQARALVFTT